MTSVSHEQESPSQNPKQVYVLKELTTDGEIGIWKFSTMEKVLNYLFKELWHVDDSLDKMSVRVRNSQQHVGWLIERNGKLYHMWVSREDVNPFVLKEYDTLFDPEKYTEEKPHTVAELREWMRRGHTISDSWVHRGSNEYWIKAYPSETSREIMESYDPEGYVPKENN